MVFKGEIEMSPESLPIIIPELQNTSVISIILGDYHYGALTSSGKLVTWGGYSRGAFGLGDPGNVPAVSSGGFMDEERQVRAVNLGKGFPLNVMTPSEVEADGRVERIVSQQL